MPNTEPVQITAGGRIIPSILELIQREFAYMDARITPPSSMHLLSDAAIADHCKTGEVWVIGSRPDACIFLSERADCLYLGKLAVRSKDRGQGYARKLVALAEQRARSKGLPAMALDVRIELVENQAAFQRMGFEIVGKGAHDGFDVPTYVIMRKSLGITHRASK